MSPVAECPRCGATVSYQVGTRPQCPVCRYPGADVRCPQVLSRGREGQGDPIVGPGVQIQRKRGNAKGSVASLVLGICSFVFVAFGFFLGGLAVILGLNARRSIRKDASLDGDGLALAGIVLGVVGLVLGGIVLAAVVFVLVRAA